ncbi:hypothetical protein HTZ84_12030 [Haloterrigena sp. SYSU A558-1]|uniref:Uncharacterized protein n=1 Tax=Haloterrigena gelatinilytica TaxID=2741724 RepID=A0ABX2LBE2_9EURY|nr:hypothetical protein [Haloterrigena gelatinilytica]NUC73031.1 hypothetical protein [Haloterrigena gelatinilytica]
MDAHSTGPRYDVTSPTRSERYRNHLETFVSDPTESNFEALWTEEALAAATEWHAATILNLWPESIAELASFLNELRTAKEYDADWEDRANWGLVIAELYTRTTSEHPIVSDQARRGLRKFGVEPATEFENLRDQLASFRDVYLDVAGHVTASNETPLPVYEEIDQLFTLVTTATADAIAAEETGPRGDLYAALRGYPAASTKDRGPIEIDFEAATPAINGHVVARQNNAYADTDIEHWAGKHYETWKWDFAEYVSEQVAASYTLDDLAADDVEPFFDAFWANADEYTDTGTLSTPVPQYLLGRWGVVQLQDFQATCLDDPEEAAAVLSMLFDEDKHLVERLRRFHTFAVSDDVSDGNLLRIATTLLMGAYPDEYVNFQYERFDTFFTACSNLDSLDTGFDARQYYRIVLACRDLRDAMRKELPDASMLDVHTLIRLYQDFQND